MLNCIFILRKSFSGIDSKPWPVEVQSAAKCHFHMAKIVFKHQNGRNACKARPIGQKWFRCAKISFGFNHCKAQNQKTNPVFSKHDFRAVKIKFRTSIFLVVFKRRATNCSNFRTIITITLYFYIYIYFLTLPLFLASLPVLLRQSPVGTHIPAGKPLTRRYFLTTFLISSFCTIVILRLLLLPTATATATATATTTTIATTASSSSSKHIRKWFSRGENQI